MTSLLWGGAFGFVWAYTVAARLMAGRTPRARHPQGSLEVPTAGSLEFRTEARPPAPAFFSWWLVVEGVHSPSRTFVRRVLLGEGTTNLAVGLPRGRYHITARWELADAFGLTRLVPRARWEAELTVVPAAEPFIPPPPPATKQGPRRPRRAGRRAGDPFDVRPYTPGDDLRRLHWPLYAHSDTPFVRTAEPTPPPSGHQFLVLDTEARSEEDLDRRLGLMVAWLADLDARSTGWVLAVPAFDRTLSAGTDPGPFLAGLTPAPFPARDVPTAWPGILSVVTGTGSRGAAALAGRLTTSRRRFQTVEVPQGSRAAAPQRQWWRRP